MILNPKRRSIAYRCPECGTSILGPILKNTLSSSMLRLKCDCEKAERLDISLTSDGKVRLSVPCIFCKQNHNYVVTDGVFFERELFLLNCPYSGMDIAFIGDEDKIAPELERTKAEIERLMTSLEAEELSDIQPTDMSEDEILPDPAVYDTIRFVLKDLEDEGQVTCPCGKGGYDLRFAPEGIQVYCESCGATHTFHATSPTLAEEYLSLDSLELK